MKKAILTTLLALTIGFTAVTVSAMTLLTNGDFETGDLTGWTPFGNAFHGTETGGNAGKLFGNFSGGFNVSGMFQQFPASPGEQYMMDADSFHLASDPMIGVGAPNNNWVVMKIAFFDAGGNEIGSAEDTILDGNSPTDVWITNPSIMGTAPVGTVSVQALILYLQPEVDGGAAHVDNVAFKLVDDPTAVTMQSGQADTVSSTTTLTITLAFTTALIATLLVVFRRRTTAHSMI